MDSDQGHSLLNAIEVDQHSDPNDGIFESTNSTYSTIKATEEDKLRQKLKCFYMNPIEKWKYKQRFPYKFFVQVIKIFVVTLQSCLLAQYRSFYIDFMSENKIVFSHLFLQGWDSSREIISYPPQSGDLAIYKVSEFYSAIDYAVTSYARLNESVGSYSYTEVNNTMVPPLLCFENFEACKIFGFNESFVFKNKIITRCINVTISADNFSTEAFLKNNNISVDFTSLVEASLMFGVKTIDLKPTGPKSFPHCYLFNLSVVLDNRAHCGKIKLSLDTTIYRLDCNGTSEYQSENSVEFVIHSVLNSIVIVFCSISLILCSRAIYRAQLLRVKAVNYFRKHHNKELTLSEKLEFINLWYLTMISSDAVIIIGSILREEIEKNKFSGDLWNTFSVLQGSGTFLIWFCVLRYLSFFDNYNCLILTLKVAAPMILRFMVCTLLIYTGFVFCGWLVLGPYHGKFRTLSVTSECLFALINGDDVFGTFSTLEPTKSILVWWFCRIFLYFFVSLFIYVVLSLFVSVILDAKDATKEYCVDGFPKNSIREFIEGSLHRRIFSDSSSSIADDFSQCCSCPISKKLVDVAKRACCCGDIVSGSKTNVSNDP